MKWYDLVAPLYDISLMNVYRSHRQETLAALDLQAGHTVVDVACGTGKNFALLREAIGSQGLLIGSDFSQPMLDQAQKKINQNSWDNVYLLQADASQLSHSDLATVSESSDLRVDRIICTLGLSVIPNWELAFERSFDLLENGGRYAIMDVYFDKLSLAARFTNVLADADIRRRFWEPLQKNSENYTEKTFPFPIPGGIIRVVAGSKATDS
jgi:ubiquinone/menaquinone biosynthesis C-methylase UbiE